MTPTRLIVVLTGVFFALLTGAHLRAQVALPLTDKILDLRGSWKRDPARRMGSICGVIDTEEMTFDVQTDPPGLVVQGVRVPLDGSPSTFSIGRTVVAATDAGWLKLTFTRARNAGFANVMQEVYILNRDRSEMTMWRTLNTVLPDGSSGKIDCGNHVALVYVRQKP